MATTPSEYDLVREELIRATQYRGTVTYKDVALVMGLREPDDDMTQAIGKQVGNIATEITKDEHEQGRPMLSAVLVRTSDRKPAPGFYELAKELGRLRSGSEDNFREREQRAVYKQWARR